MLRDRPVTLIGRALVIGLVTWAGSITIYLQFLGFLGNIRNKTEHWSHVIRFLITKPLCTVSDKGESTFSVCNSKYL